MHLFRLFLLLSLLTVCSLLPQRAMGQTMMKAGQVDVFMGVDFNYRDIFYDKVYDFLIYLTPGVKWYMGKGWMAAAQVLVPVVNDYGDYYKRVRLNMAVLSKEMRTADKRWWLKVSGGLFDEERYGLDLKGAYIVNSWMALEAQAGLTGRCSMADGWTASTPERLTGLVGADFYLKPWNTELRVRGGRFVYEDVGGQAELMRHFRHCTVGLYGEYSDKAQWNGGFKVVMMVPPYSRKRRRVNFRPATNFRLTYNVEAEAYSNKMYMTDPEENERERWFRRDEFKWGANLMEPDFNIKDKEAGQ